MKNFSKLLLLCFVFLPIVAQAAGLSFTVNGQKIVLKDVPITAWYADNVQAVAEAGIMQGYRDNLGNLTGEFGPANAVTRAEFLKMVAVMMVNRYTFDRSMTYSDDTYPWYQMYLDLVLENDPQLPLVMAIDSASLNQPILRYEAAGLLHLSLGNYSSPMVIEGYPSFTDVDLKTPNSHAIAELEFQGVITGDDATKKFNPFRTLNRAEAAKMLVVTASAYQTPLGDGAERYACESAGGTWQQWGMLPQATCNYPTSDAGKACTDGDQCEGMCIVDENNDWTCNEWKNAPGGCYTFVEKSDEHQVCLD